MVQVGRVVCFLKNKKQFKAKSNFIQLSSWVSWEGLQKIQVFTSSTGWFLVAEPLNSSLLIGKKKIIVELTQKKEKLFWTIIYFLSLQTCQTQVLLNSNFMPLLMFHKKKKVVLFSYQSGIKVISISYVKMLQHETLHTTGTKTEEVLLEND